MTPHHVGAAIGALVAAMLVGCSQTPPIAAAGSSAAPATSPVAPADTSGPRFIATDPGATPKVRRGLDWTMPAWARPAEFSGFYSEEASPTDKVLVRSVDVSWRQIQPTENGPLDLNSTADAQGLFLDGLKAQLDAPGPYWLRMFSSGVDWAPTWVVDKCHVRPVGTDYDGQQHLPIWNDCVWTELLKTWRRLLVDQGILADPDFRFAYVPGAFTWSEFDYEMVAAAVRKGDLTQSDYVAWFHRMVNDLAALGGDQRGQLVFTGEDYPWGPWNDQENLLAASAVEAGLGIRDGITEEFNFHLNETPAYAASVQPNGHLAVDDDAAPHLSPSGAKVVVGTENECYVDCGYAAHNPRYVVRMSNLKALQLRMNWVYVVPGQSLMDSEPENWDFVRLSMGQRPQTSPDAWAVLRDGEDTYWRDAPDDPPFDTRPWKGKPFVRNIERWLTQVDAPGAIARRSAVDVHTGDPTKENGISYEGLSTDVRRGNRDLAFRLDPAFSTGQMAALVKVTFWDRAHGSFDLTYAEGRTAKVRFHGTRRWKTATFSVPVTPGGQLPGGTDLRLHKFGPGDASFWMVRVIRMQSPS